MTQDQDYLKPREADDKFIKLYSIVRRAYEYHGKALLTRNPNAMYAFWSNDYQVVSESQGINHSRKVAQEYKEAKKKDVIVYLMEDFENDLKNKAVVPSDEIRKILDKDVVSSDEIRKLLDDKDVVPLDEIIKSFQINEVVSLDTIYKSSDIPKRIKDATASCASRSYAMTAAVSDTVVTSVKGAHPMTVFRKFELPIIMSTDNITKIVNISRDAPKNDPENKVDVYNLLRDEWIRSAQARLKTAKKQMSKEESAVNIENHNTALKFMALETKHSLSVIEYFNKSPQSQQPLYKSNPDGLLEYDYDKEFKRLNRCLATLNGNEKLIDVFKKLNPEDNKDKIQNALNKLFESNFKSDDVEEFIESNHWSIKRSVAHNLEETLSNIKSLLKFEDITTGKDQLSKLKNLKILSKAKSGIAR